MKKKPKHFSKLDYSVNASVNDQFWNTVLNLQRTDKDINIPFFTFIL